MWSKNALPETIKSIEQLDALLSLPSESAVEALRHVEGDVLVLGVGGKMGLTLARMIKRAADQAGAPRRVIGVSRFSSSSGDLQAKLNHDGIQTIPCDLLDPSEVARLPEAPNVIFMAGMKFGATGNESLTWAMNTHLPAVVAQRFQDSRIVAFSTGNVYSLVPVTSGGARESDPPSPLGEYAMSCLGRERIFEHFSRTQNTPMAFIRLSYANEMRYGVLVDLAKRIWNDEPIDTTMGNFNVIWQGDANAMAVAALAHAASPPSVLNVTGPEIASLRRICQDLAELMGKQVRFVGEESPNALLSDGQMGHRLFGYPSVSLQQMVRWVARWVADGGETLGKPTKFEVRDGNF